MAETSSTTNGRTAPAQESPVTSRLERAFRAHPDRIAVSAADGAATYREFERRVAGIAAQLDPACERVGILTGDDLATYAAIVAVLMAGAAYVPLNRKNPIERNRVIAESAGIGMVLASRPEPGIDALTAALPGGIDVRFTAGLTAEQRVTAADIDGDRLAYLFFTSGTTGKPKGVPVRHESLAAFMAAVVDDPTYAFSPDDRFLQMFELTFDLSVMSLLAPLCIGASTHVVPDKGIASLNIARMLGEDRITVALMVPSVLSYLRRYLPELEFPALRHSLFCGEALLDELVGEWSACVPNAVIRNVYGPTEATIFCTEFFWDRETSARQSENGVVPIGRAIGATSVAIVDAAGRPVPAGEQGELCLIGPQVTHGYWRDAARSEQAFLTLADDAGGARNHAVRAYRTGDVAYLNHEGNLIYCGRADAQIQVDGHRVELGEVEHHARAFLGGGDVAAVPRRTDDGRQEFFLFVSAGEPHAMQDHLRGKLPDYMLPKRIVAVDAFPLSLNGKIDRKKLLEQLVDGGG